MEAPSERVYDAVVVGSGASGGWAAKELCEAGLEVLLLEAGRAIDPSADFPAPVPAPRPLASRLAAVARGQGVQMRSAAFDARTRRFFVRDRDNPYTTPPGTPFNWFRGRQVGGRLHVWARVALRLSELELGAWPFVYEELAPYYEAVEDFIGVRGDSDGLTVAPDGRYAGRVASTVREERFRAAVEGMVRVVGPRLAEHDPGRVPKTIRAAAATGRLTIRPDAVVRRVTVDQLTGRATGVSFVDSHSKGVHDARARIVVLSASTIETLRIMLGSASSRHPGGLGNSSGQLGHFLMDHVLTGIGGPLEDGVDAPEPADPYDFGSVTGFLIPRFRNVDDAHPSFVGGYGIQGGIGRGAPSWYMLAHGEMVARAENRVTLHPRATDAWGVPLAHLECAHSRNETAMASDQLELMHELAAAAGLRVGIPPSGRALDRLAFRLARRRLLSSSGAFLPGSAAHEIGGAGMGDDPQASVLDPWNRVWDADNVLVTDGASFPAGCWQNVTLTIMALTVRACRHVTREYGAGRL